MLVLRSLYEEEITGEQIEAFIQRRELQRIVRRSVPASRPSRSLALGPDEYLEHLRRSRRAVGIPVIASLNGITPGGWLLVRRPDRAGRRRRPRAAHLPRGQRHVD